MKNPYQSKEDRLYARVRELEEKDSNIVKQLVRLASEMDYADTEAERRRIAKKIRVLEDRQEALDEKMAAIWEKLDAYAAKRVEDEMKNSVPYDPDDDHSY